MTAVVLDATEATSAAVPSGPARRARSGWPLLVGAVVLGVVVWRVGTGPFLDGLRLVQWWSVLAAMGITAVTTVCSAWRWRLVAAGLGVGLSMRAAVAAYYRSQFLNVTLPGGVLGDVHRAVSHGREAGDVARGARAVAWERSAGQLVQLVVTLLVLLVLPSPVHGQVPFVVMALASAGVAVVVLWRRVPRGAESLWTRALCTLSVDLREGVLARRSWPAITLASALVVAGHAATFLLAARIAGAAVPLPVLLPLALLVLLAMGIPTSLGGWGPREGMAALVFGLAGLGASLGVTTAVVYGVLSLFACLPGALVLLFAPLRPSAPGGRRALRRPVTLGVAAGGGGGHG